MVKASSKEIFRVLQAQREVGVTEIRSRAAAWFVFCWLLMIAGVFMVDQVVEWNTLDFWGLDSRFRDPGKGLAKAQKLL